MIDKLSISGVYLDVNNRINGLTYADDLVLISRSKEGLQQQTDGIQQYCQKWKLTVIIKKPKSMVFTGEGGWGVGWGNIIKTTFNIGGSPIENVKSFTYLGFNIPTKIVLFKI